MNDFLDFSITWTRYVEKLIRKDGWTYKVWLFKIEVKNKGKVKLIEKYVIKLSGQVSNLLNYLH